MPTGSAGKSSYWSAYIILYGVMYEGWFGSLTLWLWSERCIGKFTKKPSHPTYRRLLQDFVVFDLADGRRVWTSGQGMTRSMYNQSMMHYLIITKSKIRHTSPERTWGRWLNLTICLIILIATSYPSIYFSFGCAENQAVTCVLLARSERRWLHMGIYKYGY